jgi:hypothetical protein
VRATGAQFLGFHLVLELSTMLKSFTRLALGAAVAVGAFASAPAFAG